MEPKFKKLKPLSNDDLSILKSLTLKQDTSNQLPTIEELKQIKSSLELLTQTLLSLRPLPPPNAPQKPQSSPWTPEIHHSYLSLLAQKTPWAAIQTALNPLTIQQIRSHNQKFMLKLQRQVAQINVPRTDGIHRIFAAALGVETTADRVLFDDSKLLEKRAERIDSYSEVCSVFQHEMSLQYRLEQEDSAVQQLVASLVHAQEPASNWELCAMILFGISAEQARKQIAVVLYKNFAE